MKLVLKRVAMKKNGKCPRKSTLKVRGKSRRRLCMRTVKV